MKQNLDLRRLCASSMCELSICKVKYTGMKSDFTQIAQCKLQ